MGNRKAQTDGSGGCGTVGNGADGCRSLDGEALAALGAARVDDGTTATGLHADQKAVGTGAADFGSLVSAFHDDFPDGPGKAWGMLDTPKHTKRFSGKPAIIANIRPDNNPSPVSSCFRVRCNGVDKVLTS
jgi:hypothetical protein